MYLHEVCYIIHTDIKPENILIKVKESYVRNMVDHVKRFCELGVQMPKSYGKYIFTLFFYLINVIEIGAAI